MSWTAPKSLLSDSWGPEPDRLPKLGPRRTPQISALSTVVVFSLFEILRLSRSLQCVLSKNTPALRPVLWCEIGLQESAFAQPSCSRIKLESGNTGREKGGGCIFVEMWRWKESGNSQLSWI